MSIFKELSKYLEPTLAEVKKDCRNEYQPKNPLYAFKRMDEVVESGTEPVCIILGQDPYPQEGVATGLAFANKRGTPKSQSLCIIENSIIASYNHIKKEDFPTSPLPFDVTLESWINQGIMPLNSSLTVKTGCSGSHLLIWTKPMIHVIHTISVAYPKLCWIIFGSQAKLFEPCIQKESFIIHELHPAYYARQGFPTMPTDVWVCAYDYCKKTFNKEINW